MWSLRILPRFPTGTRARARGGGVRRRRRTSLGEAERVDEVPAVFKSIHLHFVVTGNNLKEAQVKRAVSLSAEKYCSASIMLSRAGVAVTHSHEVRATA